MDLSTRLTFVTMSMGTRWESYSQACLEAAFPEVRRVVLNGRRDWNPLRFIDVLDDVSTDYLIHVDEDCFVIDREQLTRLIVDLDDHPQQIIAGTPDGGTFHRDHNPHACNPFFLVMKREPLREVLAANRDWRKAAWCEQLAARPHALLGDLDAARVRYDDFERYYALFWAVLGGGHEIRYLLPGVDGLGLHATDLRLEGAGRPMALHMWWLRDWAVETVEPYLGVSHRFRYERLAQLFADGGLVPAVSAGVLRRHHLRRFLRRARWRLQGPALGAGLPSGSGGAR